MAMGCWRDGGRVLARDFEEWMDHGGNMVEKVGKMGRWKMM
jgi:hypothetical protein